MEQTKMDKAQQTQPATTESDTATESVASIDRIGRAMSRMRLMIGRRFIGQQAIRKFGAGLELSHLDVVQIVHRIGLTQEATIGAIAEQMRIDPSRGSRIVSELVQRGVLRREVSQQDARRSIVVLTPAGEALLTKLTEAKVETIFGVVGDWAEEDRAVFADLFERFVNGFEQRYERFAAEGEASKGRDVP